MCSFTSQCNDNIELVSILIDSELNKIADWIAVDKPSPNVQKNKKQIYDISLPSKDYNGKWYSTPHDK